MGIKLFFFFGGEKVRDTSNQITGEEVLLPNPELCSQNIYPDGFALPGNVRSLLDLGFFGNQTLQSSLTEEKQHVQSLSD